jgi:hypothetical protein
LSSSSAWAPSPGPASPSSSPPCSAVPPRGCARIGANSILYFAHHFVIPVPFFGLFWFWVSSIGIHCPRLHESIQSNVSVAGTKDYASLCSN